MCKDPNVVPTNIVNTSNHTLLSSGGNFHSYGGFILFYDIPQLSAWRVYLPGYSFEPKYTGLGPCLAGHQPFLTVSTDFFDLEMGCPYS